MGVITDIIRDELSRIPTKKEWFILYQESEKQSVLGIMLDAIERLPEEQRPPRIDLLQWIGLVQAIEQNTIKISKASEEAVKYFRGKGGACTLLKGSAVGRYYPNPKGDSLETLTCGWMVGGSAYMTWPESLIKTVNYMELIINT